MAMSRLLAILAVLCSPLHARRLAGDATESITQERRFADDSVQLVETPTIAKFADACQVGIAAVNEGISKFMESPPDIPGGIDVLREKLWTVVEVVVPAQALAQDRALKGRWDKAFGDLSSTSTAMQEIYFSVQRFQSNGNATALRIALFDITEVPFQVLVDSYPEGAKYFEALKDLINGAGKSWRLFFDGKPEEAMAVIWQGINISIREVLPQSLVNDLALDTVMNHVDGALGELNRHVVDYRKRIMEATVCYKNVINRGKVRPDVCREGFVWDGDYRCLPLPTNGADCWVPCGYSEGICPGFCGDDKVCCKRGENKPDECQGAYGYVDFGFTEGNSKDYHQCVYRADIGHEPEEDDEAALLQEDLSFSVDHSLGDRTKEEGVAARSLQGWPINLRPQRGAYPAKCNMSGEYTERHSNGQYCVTKCSEGFIAKNSDQCVQVCDTAGKFKADGKKICGTDPGEVTATYADIVSTLAWNGLQIGQLVKDMHENGMDIDKLKKTLTAFIEIGKSFAKPMCPLSEALLPDPNAATGGVTPAFTIENCGMEELNGNWVRKGWTHHRPRYEKIGAEDHVAEWSKKLMAWRIFINGQWFGFGRKTLYVNKNNWVIMPSDGWEAQDGTLPAPTVVHGSELLETVTMRRHLP